MLVKYKLIDVALQNVRKKKTSHSPFSPIPVKNNFIGSIIFYNCNEIKSVIKLSRDFIKEFILLLNVS